MMTAASNKSTRSGKISRFRTIWLVSKALLASPWFALIALPCAAAMLTLNPDILWRNSPLWGASAFTTFYIFWIFTQIPTLCLRKIDSLPISRRSVFRAIFSAALATLLIGLGGRALSIQNSEKLFQPSDLVEIHHHEEDRRLTVSQVVHRFSKPGQVPAIVAPWGESQTPRAVEFNGESSSVLYSPFDVPPGSSDDYFVWQIGRAVEAIYDQTISAEKIREHVFQEEPCKITAETIDENLIARDLSIYYPLCLLSFMTAWLAFYLPYTSFLRATVSRIKFRIVSFALFGIMMIVLFGPISYLFEIDDFSADPERIAAWRIWAYQIDVHSLGPTAVWLTTIVLLAAFYRLGATCFERIELIHDEKGLM